MHDAKRYVQHDDAPGRDPKPCGERYRHVLIRYVVNSKLMKYMLWHIGPKLIAKEAEGSQDPHEEAV